MPTTRVQAQCSAVKKEKNWNEEHPVQYEITLDIPYDQASVYFRLSGGTSITLRTINEAAAEMFEPGKNFFVDISPCEQTPTT